LENPNPNSKFETFLTKLDKLLEISVKSDIFNKPVDGLLGLYQRDHEELDAILKDTFKSKYTLNRGTLGSFYHRNAPNKHKDEHSNENKDNLMIVGQGDLMERVKNIIISRTNDVIITEMGLFIICLGDPLREEHYCAFLFLHDMKENTPPGKGIVSPKVQTQSRQGSKMNSPLNVQQNTQREKNLKMVKIDTSKEENPNPTRKEVFNAPKKEV
jgi:hypothetical protein